MIVSIAGMHRSGTSMITRMLHICGLHLGDQRDLLPAAPDNPEGFWENGQFRTLNERILKSFGGNWDYPPILHQGWEKSEHLTLLKERTNQLIAEFKHYDSWGWKDPQNSLTLAYWRAMLPGLKVLVCVRNPFDVYRSLAMRGSASSCFAYALWLKYFNTLIPSLPNDYVVTHFESYFHDPQAELRRVVGLLGLDVPEQKIEEAAQTIKPNLRNNQNSISKLVESEAPAELISLYQKLCQHSGGISLQSHNSKEIEELSKVNSESVSVSDARHVISILRSEIDQLKYERAREVHQLHCVISSLQNQLNDKTLTIKYLQTSRGRKMLEKSRLLAEALWHKRIARPTSCDGKSS